MSPASTQTPAPAPVSTGTGTLEPAPLFDLGSISHEEYLRLVYLHWIEDHSGCEVVAEAQGFVHYDGSFTGYAICEHDQVVSTFTDSVL